MSHPTSAPETAEHVSFDELSARFFEREPRVDVRAEFAALSHVGKVRENNEDHYLVVERKRSREILLTSLAREGLPQNEDVSYNAAVADGMGGRDFGELASYLALRTGWVLGDTETRWNMKVNEHLTDELRQRAEVAFRLIHRALRELARRNPRMSGMGTTLTAAYSVGDTLYIMHAGDSRAYLLHRGQLQRLTRDHTMAQMLVETGVAEPGSEMVLKTKRVLTNCLGANELNVEMDFVECCLGDGDVLLLCTDGLSDLVEDAEIQRLVSQHADNPQAACKALVEKALDQGGRDNVTVVVGRYTVPDVSRPSTGLTTLLPAVLDRPRPKRKPR